MFYFFKLFFFAWLSKGKCLYDWIDSYFRYCRFHDVPHVEKSNWEKTSNAIFLSLEKKNLLCIIPLYRCYLVIFFFLFLLSELEVTGESNFLSISNWVYRGFLYTFFGTITMEQHDALAYSKSFHKTTKLGKTLFFKEYWNPDQALLYVQISSWWILSLGIFYFLMGITCLQIYRDRLRDRYRTQLEHYTART